MTEREKHEAIVIAAFDVAHSMFERAVLAWDFFGDDERKKIIDAVLAESKRVGLVPESWKFRQAVDDRFERGRTCLLNIQVTDGNTWKVTSPADLIACCCSSAANELRKGLESTA
jgi:hypothetical protein